MSLTYGELFAGYDGLGMGVRSVLGGETRWFCEFDKAPSAILAHHYPHVPNFGDVTKVDWHAVEPVDVITGGSPCQDLSHAGKRAGMKAGTRSGLWASMCDAIDIIRPRLVVWENVRGALSAAADSALEPCAGCVGDGDDGPVLRALGRVLGDLAELGYDARWYGLRAADVGAAHGRFRIFLFATPTDADLTGLEGRRLRGERPGELPPGPGGVASVEHVPGQLTLLPTPVADNSRGLPSATTDYASLPNVAVSLLPTPRATRGGSGTETRDLLLPTPRATDGTKGGPNQRGSSGDLMLPSAVQKFLPTPQAHDAQGQDWREYEAAIRRQEHAFGRPAPLPTETGPKGNPRLSPRFVEWLMALPEGWVTDVPGISRNDMLKALGNGVTPPQAAAATRAFLHDISKEKAA